jgi:hypothetical protein
MKIFSQVCIGVGVTGILLIGWARAKPAGWGGPAEDIGQLPDILTQIAADEQVSAELENRSTELLRANDIKRVVARDVLLGRMTLAQAVDRYREIHEHLPISWASMRRHYEGDTDRERWCRNVLSWVESEAGDQPNHRAALARLDLEMQRYLEETNP